MDAPPQFPPPGLAPLGAGTTGAPLVDWVLPDPGLAGTVLSFLTPRTALPLRAACRAGRAAVAAHAWEIPMASLCTDSFEEALTWRRFRVCRFEYFACDDLRRDWGYVAPAQR
jgi:hypothetical protein